MKKILPILVASGLLLSSCGDDDQTPTGGDGGGPGRISIEAYDAPPPVGVENVFINIAEVSVNSAQSGWIVLAEPDSVYDFLELVNGATAALVDTTLDAGSYNQLRLKLAADGNEVVIEGERSDLKVPSGAQSGIKLNLNFDIESDELVEILVDFDVSRSIKWTPHNYQMTPTFKAFKKIISGTVAGTAADSLGQGVHNALIEATMGDDVTATLTDTLGRYQLILLEGTYDIAASADAYTRVDTTYAGVSVAAEAQLQELDFTLRE